MTDAQLQDEKRAHRAAKKQKQVEETEAKQILLKEQAVEPVGPRQATKPRQNPERGNDNRGKAKEDEEEEEYKDVGVVVEIDLLKIDDMEENFLVDYHMNLQWKVKPSKEDKEYGEMSNLVADDEIPEWKPDVQFYNVMDGQEVCVPPKYFRRKNYLFCYYNWKLTIRESLEFQRFPFDRQILPVVAFSTNSVFIDYDTSLGVPDSLFEGIAKNAVTVGVEQHSWVLDDEVKVESKRDDQEFLIAMRLTRVPIFYLYNIVLLTYLLVLVALSVCAIDVFDFTSRLSILITVLLTLLDKYIIVSFLFIALIVLESFVLVYLNVNVAESLNTVFSIILLILWTAIHIFVVIGWFTNLFVASWDDVIKGNRTEPQTAIVSKITLLK